MLSTADLIAVKEAIETMYTDGINAIVSVDVDEDNKIFGTFRDGKKLFDFTLDPDAEDAADQLSYSFANPDVLSKNDADIDWQWELKNDAHVFIFPEYWRGDAEKKCSKGMACGNTCLPWKTRSGRDTVCGGKEKLSAETQQKTRQVRDKITKGARVGDLTRKEMQDAILKEFGGKSLKELAQGGRFRGATAGKNFTGKDLQKTSTLAQVYRNNIGVIPNDPVNKKGERGVFNGINALNYFRPWNVFNLDPKTASKDDINQAFDKISKGLDKKDPELYDRLKLMRDSITYDFGASPKTRAGKGSGGKRK